MIRRIALVLIVAFRWPIDLVMSVLLIPAGFVLKIFRMIGAGRLRLSTSVLRNIGVFPIRDHYYEPLFNPAYLTTELNQDRFFYRGYLCMRMNNLTFSLGWSFPMNCLK